jgi:hypothetical protein
MTLSLPEQLTALARGFSLKRLPPPSGANPRQISVKLTPPASALGSAGEFIDTITQALDPVTSRAIVPTNMNVNLGWHAKNVRFQTTDLADPAIVGGMPVADALTPTLDSLTVGDLPPALGAIAGVPGVIGALTGTFQLPVDQVTVTTPKPKKHKVGIELRITITDPRGNRVPIGHSSLDTTAPMFAEVPGDELILPVGMGESALQQLHLVLTAVFVDQGTNVVATVDRTIRASLRLSAGGALSDPAELPPLNVTIPAIPVPAVLILCENEGFTGRMIVLLPADSPVNPIDTTDTTNLAGFLNPLMAALGTLVPPGANSPAPHPLIAFLGTMGTGAFITGLRPVADTIVFAKGDQIANLDDYPFRGGLPGFTRSSPEDMAQSLVFIGVPVRKVQLFNDRSFDYRQGQIDITLGPEMYTFVRSLGTATPVSDLTPDGTPNRVNVIQRPGGYRGFLHTIQTFGQELSSLIFRFGS